MEKESFTKRELQFNITDIVNISLLHMKNVIEQIQYLYNCAVNFTPAEPYKILPTNNFSFIIHTSDNKNRSFNELKNDSVQWIIKTGVEEFILGINLCLSEAYTCLKYLEIVQEANKSWNGEKIDKEIQKVHKDAKKLPIPTLIEKIENILGQVLQMKEEILSINKYRVCLVHRNGIVSEVDVSSVAQSLVLKWFDFEFIVKLQDGTITKMEYDLRKDGIEIEIKQIIFRPYQKEFNLGEKVSLNIDEFNGLGITTL